MAWTVTTGTITGEAGSLITLLDLELVTNRGWTKEYTGTNKAAYRSAAGGNGRAYYRIDDSGPGAGGASEARLRGYISMTDVDTGTSPFPSVAQAANGVFIRKSATLDATARSYIAAGDDKTFILMIATGDSGSIRMSSYFGEFETFVPGDSYGACVIARPTENSVSITSTNEVLTARSDMDIVAPLAQSGHYKAADALNLPNSTAFGKFDAYDLLTNGSGSPNTTTNLGRVEYPNSTDGSPYVVPWTMFVPVTGNLITISGRLRGIYLPMHASTSLPAEGAVFPGTGDTEGLNLRLVRNLASGSSTQALLWCVLTNQTATV